MSTEKLKTNKKWLVWARESVHFNKYDIAKKLNVSKQTIDEWEDTGYITYSSLVKLSKIYRLSPFIFFNSNPPSDEKRINDYRSINNKNLEITPDIAFEVRNAKSKRQNLLDVESEEDTINIKSFDLKDYEFKNEEGCISILKEVLELNNAKRSVYKLNDWINRIQDLGVLIFQFYNIDVKQLRGYALYYDKLPIIGINHKESDKSKKFTLFFELAHLLLKNDGLSNFGSYNLNHPIEINCNKIATETLIPTDTFKNKVNTLDYKDFKNIEYVDNLANHFKISNEAIIRKALDLGYIGPQEYANFKKEFDSYIFDERKIPKGVDRKPKVVKKSPIPAEIRIRNAYKRKASRNIAENGNFYINFFIDAYERGIITDLELSNNLNVSLDVLDVIRERFYKGGR